MTGGYRGLMGDNIGGGLKNVRSDWCNMGVKDDRRVWRPEGDS